MPWNPASPIFLAFSRIQQMPQAAETGAGSLGPSPAAHRGHTSRAEGPPATSWTALRAGTIRAPVPPSRNLALPPPTPPHHLLPASMSTDDQQASSVLLVTIYVAQSPLLPGCPPHSVPTTSKSLHAPLLSAHHFFRPLHKVEVRPWSGSHSSGLGSSLPLTVHTTLNKPLGLSEPPIAHL